MLAIERRNMIKKILVESGVVSVATLSQRMGVSETTIRRDLDFLEGEQVLKKVHGGAMIQGNNEAEEEEPLYRDREGTLVSEKEEIAELASTIIEDGETIFIDSGTTTASVIKYLKGKKGITVVTNSINIAYELQDFFDIQVVVIGGSLRHRTGAFVGSIAVETLKGFWVDKLLLSCSGICPEGGVTVTNLVTLEIRRQMVASAKQVIVLADHTKIGQRHLARVADLEEIDCIITDSIVSREVIDRFEQAGTKVITRNAKEMLT
jgi:DeoR family fructose operon transcriptional repressor